MTLSEKSAEAGHRAVSLHRDCVLVFNCWESKMFVQILKMTIFVDQVAINDAH